MEKIKGGTSLQIKTDSRRAIKQKGLQSGGSYSIIRAWFRSRDLWVMGPPRFRCATLIVENKLYQKLYNLIVSQISVPISLFLCFGCVSFSLPCTNTIKQLLGKQFTTLIKTHKRYQSKKQSLINKKIKKRE